MFETLAAFAPFLFGSDAVGTCTEGLLTMALRGIKTASEEEKKGASTSYPLMEGGGGYPGGEWAHAVMEKKR